MKCVLDTSNQCWVLLGSSVRGSSHARTGLPNQDSIGFTGGALPLILCVSDGHGSERCVRSEIGSDLAVKTATLVVREFAQSMSDKAVEDVRQLAKKFLPSEIVKRWKYAVREHRQENPFNQEELEKLGEKARQSLDEDGQYVAYGATLLLTVIAETYSIFLQLGDGDILTVFSSGEVQRALEDDPDLIANETTSLCLSNAAHLFRSRFTERQEGIDEPKLILLSTDGYGNAFATDDDFMKVGSDLLGYLSDPELGGKYVEEHLESWLEKASSQGSGDDVSVVLACRGPADGKLSPE